MYHWLTAISVLIQASLGLRYLRYICRYLELENLSVLITIEIEKQEEAKRQSNFS